MGQVAQRAGRCPIPGNIQGQVDGALSNLIQLQMSLFIALGLDKTTLKNIFQSKVFYDSKSGIRSLLCMKDSECTLTVSYFHPAELGQSLDRNKSTLKLWHEGLELLQERLEFLRKAR